MIMIYHWDKKLKKQSYVLEADMNTFKKKQHWFGVSDYKDAFLKGRIPNDSHCASLSNKSLLY